MEKQNFLNTRVNNLTMEETIDSIKNLINSDKKSYVVALNVDVVMKIEHDDYLKEIIDNADLTLVDGKPLVWISNMYDKPIKEKVSGSDLVPILCEVAAENDYSIFLIGGKEGVAKQAKQRLEDKYQGIDIAGIYSPPYGFENDKAEILKINEMISEKKPDLLIVCLGCPKQEKWIYENINNYDARVSVCAGATIDFLAGNIKRAPKWMSNNGLEWFYRFLQEPKRLFRRYFIDDIKIIKLIFKYK